MSTSGLKAIAPVPTAADFLDIVLSKTQRKTPTVRENGLRLNEYRHAECDIGTRSSTKNFKISRIRNFYMRKVKFCQDCFDEKLGAILTEFPMLDDLHPFLSSLMNVLYDKNHYKLALGQLRTARHLIDHVAKDYCRLLKFGDSLYRCKQLKKAALGRMATIMKRKRTPSPISSKSGNTSPVSPPSTPTPAPFSSVDTPTSENRLSSTRLPAPMSMCKPYAFTTKSLFVGHLDYKYLRWQVIDTPGILDHPLEEMNTIEMQSITAMAHLKSAILYFRDLSEQCGYTVECKLFHSIKPLFATKPTVLVLTKIDVMKLEELHPDNRALTSCATEEGVMDLKNKACDALLAHRVDLKMKGSKITSVANRHVAQPKPRDDVPGALHPRRCGAGVYNINIKRDYLLANPEWKFDIMPEFMDGKNVADFVDPDIADKLEALEREEERLEAEGFYANEEEMFDSDDEREALEMVDRVGHKNAAQMGKKGTKNQARLPRTAGLRTITELTEQQRAEMLAKIVMGLTRRCREYGNYCLWAFQTVITSPMAMSTWLLKTRRARPWDPSGQQQPFVAEASDSALGYIDLRTLCVLGQYTPDSVPIDPFSGIILLRNRKNQSIKNAISRLPAAVPPHSASSHRRGDAESSLLCGTPRLDHHGSLSSQAAHAVSTTIIRTSLDPRQVPPGAYYSVHELFRFQVARGTPIRLYFDIPMPSLVCLTSVSEKDHGIRAAPLAAVCFTEDAHGMGMPRRPLRHPTEGPVDALGYPSALDIATLDRGFDFGINDSLPAHLKGSQPLLYRA
ncbi:hypothetical protein DFP72DRAFT_1108138 [Ephemerocybe angulata]|uniref:Uncharacterized protein n=1 Tax=Ephemerocybe angulata TaxID=980116 RepID=A0A8H6IGU8_9AGAR|nr:hypothetical protein DFP72DRAFT_1108138 [Tulosesus angulatus]